MNEASVSEEIHKKINLILFKEQKEEEDKEEKDKGEKEEEENI
jgi:hypothetical protein